MKKKIGMFIGCVLVFVLITGITAVVFYKTTPPHTREKIIISYYNLKSRFYHPFPKVSVLIPAYNRQDLLPRAVDSILTQTFTDFELILLDDGSMDSTFEVMKSYQKKDTRVRIYQNDKNKGIGYSRNHLIELARADYLAIMDSDDKSLPNRLQDEVDYLDSRPDADLVSGLVVFMDYPDCLMTYYSQKEQHIPVDMFFKCSISHSASMIRKSYLDKSHLRYDDTLVANLDYDLFKRILLKKGKFGLVEKPVLAYRAHNTNSAKYYSHQVRSTRQIHQDLQSIMIDLPPKELEYITYCNRLNLMREGNKKLKWFEDYIFQEIADRDCNLPPETIGYFYFVDNVNHSMWQDFVIENKENNTAFRRTTNISYPIVAQEENSITLNIGGKYGRIQFKRDAGRWMAELNDVSEFNQ